MKKQNHIIEKSVATWGGVGLLAGVGYTAAFGKIGIAGAFTFGSTVILPATIAGVAVGSLVGMVRKHYRKKSKKSSFPVN